MDDKEFMGVVNANEYHLNSLYGNDKNVLQIFDHVEENDALPMYDLDPDLNFYNEYVHSCSKVMGFFFAMSKSGS